MNSSVVQIVMKMTKLNGKLPPLVGGGRITHAHPKSYFFPPHCLFRINKPNSSPESFPDSGVLSQTLFSPIQFYLRE